MAEDLVLDTAIRDWVWLLSVVLIGILCYFVSKLETAESTQMQMQLNQLAAILDESPAPFETFISLLMSPSNEQRSLARSTFNLMKETDPNSLALQLAELIYSSHHVEASAILLRELLTRDIWPCLPWGTQFTIKSVLLTAIKNENSQSVIKQLCNTISVLASLILPENEWPEIRSFMFQCMTSTDVELEVAFLLFSQLDQDALPYIKGFFLQFFRHPAGWDVRIAVLKAVIIFIQRLNSASDRDWFQDLLPAMMWTLTNALKNGAQEATAQEALNLLIELAGTGTGTGTEFFRRELVAVVVSMLQIAEAEDLEEGTRHLAIKFMITLAKRGMMTESPQFIRRLFFILMKMLLDVEDNPAWHTAEAESEDARETNNYSFGRECLDTLSIALGGNPIVPVAFNVFRAYLAAPEWQKRHAAIIALAQIAKGCPEVMIMKWGQRMVLNSFQDPHSRVRWAAVNSILPSMFQCVTSSDVKLQESAFLIFSQLAQYKGDTLVPYVEDLHPVFLEGLNHPASSDVKIAALSAVINFIRCLNSASDQDRFQDLLPAMMNTLIDALKRKQEATAQEALKLLIELARTVPGFFRWRLVVVVRYMLRIAEAETFEEGTRHLAIDFVMTLAEASKGALGMMTKLPQFISRSITKLFDILMKMLLDVEDDPAWHTAEVESEDAGETSNYSFGQECLDRLSIALGGNAIVPRALRVFRADLAASDWKKRHAALIALARIGKGCSKVMIENLFVVVVNVLHHFKDTHARVRWAAVNAIGQLSTDLGPHLQVQYHEHVLPKLAKAMGDLDSRRVQARAAAAVFEFGVNCNVKSLPRRPFPWEILASADAILGRGRGRAGLSRGRITGPFQHILISGLARYRNQARYRNRGVD